MQPEAFAAFLGASMNYYNKYNLKIQVNQFSTSVGGHSGHSGSGQFIDYRYTSTNGNKNEPVWTQNANFDKAKSQFMVDQLVKFGYNSTPSSLRGNRYSILTQQGFTSSPALTSTSYYTGHHHHVHLQNYDLSHVSPVDKLSITQPKLGTTNSSELQLRQGSSYSPSLLDRMSRNWENFKYEFYKGMSQLGGY